MRGSSRDLLHFANLRVAARWMKRPASGEQLAKRPSEIPDLHNWRIPNFGDAGIRGIDDDSPPATDYLD